METLLYLIVVFFAVFVQAVAGFGLPLVAMSLLLMSLGVLVATPLVALITLTVALALSLRYRSSFDLKAMRLILIAVLAGIPAGIWLIQVVDERIFTALLGAGIVLYAVLELVNLYLPRLSHSVWTYVFGFLAGILSSAYNLGGPIMVIYGSSRRWPPAEFRRNMQIFFIVSSLFVIISHGLAGNLNTTVLQYYLAALPASAAGLFVGMRVGQRISPAVFRKAVLLLLILMGMNLLF